MSIERDLREAVRAINLDPDLAALLEEAKAAVDSDPEVRVKVAEAVGRELLWLRDLRTELGRAEAYVESVLARVMPVKTLDFPGLRLERRGGATKTTWDDESLVRDLPKVLAGGDAERAEALARAGAELLRFLHVDYWRSTALKEAGLDPDEYRATEGYRRSVQVSACRVRAYRVRYNGECWWIGHDGTLYCRAVTP